MTDTMLERMARAGYEKYPVKVVKDDAPVAWDHLDGVEKSILLDAQRTALAAMHEYQTMLSSDERPDCLTSIVHRAADKAQSDVEMFGIVAAEILHRKVLAPLLRRKTPCCP